ncbi:phage tail protein [Kitasatospora sp. NPDC048540]|uniref:phage tail protein n=1 Tax=unclassified Kitasatospora TaxID=2633591 RepID=UPI00053AF431|nr:phage tail protein [Kitasatospora sp. MBT63]
MSIASIAVTADHAATPTGLATGASAAASMAHRAAAGAAFRQYGLSMRFTVTFEGATSVPLGEWSACRGLKVDFRTETVKVGGDYSGEVKLPGQVVYSAVVLERAMESKSSQDLQNWLARFVASWMNDDENGAHPPKGTVKIVLQDVHQQPVAAWTLHDAYPASWSGPVMDAKQNAVAIETLTLEHAGFLP